jgi:hypothetical protein
LDQLDSLCAKAGCVAAKNTAANPSAAKPGVAQVRFRVVGMTVMMYLSLGHGFQGYAKAWGVWYEAL